MKKIIENIWMFILYWLIVFVIVSSLTGYILFDNKITISEIIENIVSGLISGFLMYWLISHTKKKEK